MDEATRKMLRDQVASAVEARDGTAYGRAQRELPPLDVHVCLGPGRCMFPRQGADSRVCAFCMKYPSGYGTSQQVDAITDRFFKGH